MKKYTVLDMFGEDGEYLNDKNGNIVTFDTLEEALAVGKRTAEELRHVLSDRDVRHHYVQINAEEVDEDGEIVDYIDSIERIDLTKDFEVDVLYRGTNHREAIDVIRDCPADYTAEDYIRDCESNADNDWVQMLHDNTVELWEIED